jgi:hypothetical protein
MPAPPVPVERTSVWVPFLAALLAIGVAGGGLVAYKYFTTKDEPETPLGVLAARSASQRPAWIASETTSACTERSDKALACVGVSGLASTQEEAEDDAQDAATDALIAGLGAKISDKAWRGAVLPIYASARDAKLATFDRDPASSAARRDVREARRAEVKLLKATSGTVVPLAPSGHYWEAYDHGGRRYIAWTQVVVTAPDAKKLIELYAKPTPAMGAQVVPVFPAIGWRYPKLEGGAVVTTVGDGYIKQAGIAPPAVIVAANHVAIASPANIESALDEAILQNSPIIALDVETDGGTQAFHATLPDTTPPETHEHPKHPGSGGSQTPVITPGGVNVWDRYNGRGGREDPSQ